MEKLNNYSISELVAARNYLIEQDKFHLNKSNSFSEEKRHNISKLINIKDQKKIIGSILKKSKFDYKEANLIEYSFLDKMEKHGIIKSKKDAQRYFNYLQMVESELSDDPDIIKNRYRETMKERYQDSGKLMEVLEKLDKGIWKYPQSREEHYRENEKYLQIYRKRLFEIRIALQNKIFNDKSVSNLINLDLEGYYEFHISPATLTKEVEMRYGINSIKPKKSREIIIQNIVDEILDNLDFDDDVLYNFRAESKTSSKEIDEIHKRCQKKIKSKPILRDTVKKCINRWKKEQPK